MVSFHPDKKSSILSKIVSSFVAFTFILTIVLPPQMVSAQVAPQTVLNLPVPGTMLSLTNEFMPAMIKGVTVDPENPLHFNFIVDTGEENLAVDELTEEGTRLIKYFLASLTVPDDEMWVNLSPYEKGRIISQGLGQTEMGRDLLSQDYLLKQLSSSLMYPEKELGNQFWKRVYQKAYEQYNTTDIPVDTFNKVWIVPDKATVYEHDKSAFVVERHLKVMLEEDYLAMTKSPVQVDGKQNSELVSKIIREIIIPEIEKEINTGENFANLRQIYNSMILATWFKRSLKESLLGKVYVDQNKVKGVDVKDKQIKQKIYDQYLAAFKKGVYNYIREDYDPVAQEVIPRKYFSGGLVGIPENTFKALPKDTALTVQQQREAPDGVNEFALDVNLLEETGTGTNTDVVEQAMRRARGSGEDFAMATSPAQRAREQIKQQVFQEIAQMQQEINMTERARIYLESVYRQYLESQEPNIPDEPEAVLDENFYSTSSEKVSSEKVEEITGLVRNNNIQQRREELLAFAKDNIIHLSNGLNAGKGTSLDREAMLPEWFGRTEIGAKGTDTGWINIDVVGFDAQGNRVSRKETIPVTEYKIIKLMEYAQSYNLNILEEIVSTDSIPPLEEFLEQTYYFDRIDDRIPQAEKRTYRQVLNERQDTQLNDFQETIQPMIPIIDVENDKLIHQIGSKNVLTPGGHGQVWTDQLQMNLARFDSMDVGDKIVISTITNSDGPNNNFAPEHLAEMARKGYAIMMMAAERAPLDAKGGILGILKLEDGTEVLDLMELAQAETTNKVPEFKAQGLKTGRIGEQLFNTNNAAANLNVLIPFLKDLKKHFQESMGETEGTKFFNSLVTGDLMGNPKKKEGKEVIQLETVMGKAILKLHRWLEKNRTQDQDIEALFQKHNIDQLVHVLVVENENRTETFTPIKFAWDLGLYFFSDHFDLEVDLDNETMHMVNNRNGHLPGFGDMHKRYKKVENIIAALGTNVSMIDLDELNLPGEAQVYLPNAILRGEVTVDNKSGKPVSLYDYVGSDEVSEENARGELEESQLQLSQDGRIIIDNKRYVIEKDGHLRIVDNLFDQAMTTSKDPAIAVDLKTPVPTGQYQRTGEATVEDINPDMFRAYDYRNEGKPLTPDVVEAMGYYFAQSALEKARKAGIENRTVVIAKDARAIETELEDALVTALTNAGLNVKFIAVNRPNAVTQYSGAVQLLKPLMGIFLTASHLSRPKDQPVRGFKVAQMQEPGGAIISLSDVEIQNESKQAVYDFIQNPEKMDALNAETQGTVEGLDIDQDIVRLNVLFAKVAMERGSLYDLGQELYNAHNAQEAYAVLEKWEERYAHVQRPFEGLKVAIDGAHAGTGPIAKAIYEELGATVHDVNMDVEWVYGEHNADPAVQANRRELQNLIRETESDFGFTNDLDGDRLALELPYRLPTQPETRFSLVEPDSLMEFLLPPLMNQWGYGNVKTGIIRDVLGSSALDLKAGSLDMLMDQTDAGYPHLKRKKAEREKEYKARGEEIVFPIFGEKSGHIWTHFTGEMENPTATALLFTVLMAQAREQAQEMTRNEAYNVLEEGTITYSKSARVQPLFHPSLLQILSDAEFNNTGWEFNENPEEFKNPPSSLVKRGKDYTIRKLMEEFTVGKEFETAVGTLKVSAFNTKKDDEAVGGMYQFADINFEHQGEFVGRVIFRASSNDPTFVSAYEAVATEGRDVGLEFRNASMKTVYDFLRQEQLAIVTLDELALLPLTEKAKSNAVNKFNLEILAQDYKEASQAAGEDQAMVVGPDTDQRSVKVRVPGIYELVTQDNIIDTEDIWRLVTDSKGVRLLNQRRRFNKYKVFEKLVVPQLITDSAVPFNILVTPDRDVMIQAQDQRVHINTPFMGEIRRFDADGVAPEEVAATAAPQTRENIVIRPRDQMITIRTMEEKAIPPRTQEIAVLDKGTGQGQHIRLGNQAGPVQITVGERQWDLNITRSQREVQFTVTDDEGYSSGFQVLDITGREAEIGQQWKSDKLPFSIGVSGKADFHIRKDTSEPLLVSQSVETSASDAAMVVRDVVKKIEGLAPAEVQMLDLGEGIPKTIEGIRALIETIDQEKADTTLEDVAEVLSPSEIALWAAMVSQTTGMDVNAIEEQIRRIALESQGETTWDMDALLSESEIMFLAQRSLGDDITEDQAMTVSDIMRRDVESVIQEVTILERSDAQKRVGEYVDSLITSRGEQSEIIQSVGMLMEMLIQEEITFPDAEVSGPFLGLIQHLSPRIVAIGNDPNNKEVVVDVAKRKRKWSFQDDSVREAIARWVITHRQSQMLSEDAGQEKVTEMLRQAVEAFKIGPMKSVAFNPVDVLHLAFPGTLTDQQVMGWTQQIETLLQNDPSFATSRADPSGTYVYQGKEYGGINLDPNLLDLQIKRDGNGVPLPLTDQAIENMHIEGFIPVIINVTPITNLPLMLGFADGENPFASNTNPDEDHATPSLSFHVTRDPMDLKVKIENA